MTALATPVRCSAQEDVAYYFRITHAERASNPRRPGRLPSEVAWRWPMRGNKVGRFFDLLERAEFLVPFIMAVSSFVIMVRALVLWRADPSIVLVVLFFLGGSLVTWSRLREEFGRPGEDGT